MNMTKTEGIKRNKKRRTKRGALKLTFGLLFLGFAGLLIAASVIFRFDEWRSFDASLILDCDKSAIVCDSNGDLVCIASAGEKRIWVGIESIPDVVVNAFVSAEDARFYTHDGIDIVRIFGAAWADIRAGGYVQGASTISQQLIKLSHLSSEKTLDRKLEEAVLAMTLEDNYSKDEIMEMYLNYVYFGGGYYGIEAASLGFFGVDVSALTTAQAAQLAGILKSPSAYAPHIDMDASVGRRDTILGLMKEYGYIEQQEYDEAIAEEPVLKCAFPTDRNTYIDFALSEACELSGLTMDELLASGVEIYTTLNTEINDYCISLMNDDANFPIDAAQGALTVLDDRGGIIAMVGGRGEYTAQSLNRAADIERQPGSLIKPILVYAPAIELYGCSAATMLYDEQKSFGTYTPRNSDDKYFGWVTMRTAVTKSLNVPAVELLSRIGLPSAVLFAQSVGISFENEEIGLSIALGGFTYGVSTLEMAGAFSMLSDEGVYIKPTSIERIDSDVFDYSRAQTGKRVMTEANAYILTSMLQSVAKEGTGRRLNELGMPIAAKTGTSVDENGVRDAWCAVYSSEYTAVAWMGLDSSAQGSLPSEAVGGSCTALLLSKLYSKLYEERDCPDFAMPSNVESVRLDIRCIEQGKCALASALTPDEYVCEEVFSVGTSPLEIDSYWTLPRPPDEIGWSISAYGSPVISFCPIFSHLEYRLIRVDQLGNELTIYTITNTTELVSYTDTTAVRGAVYTYYVVAVHPELLTAGEPTVSEPSRKLRVVVPFD